MAYLMESDFAFFYKKAAESVDLSEEKEFFIKMSEWEEGHKNMFYSRYRQLLEKYWGDVSDIVFEK
jgi:rubrerythrin